MTSTPTEDNLLVFYIPDGEEWETRVGKMTAAGWKEVRVLTHGGIAKELRLRMWMGIE